MEDEFKRLESAELYWCTEKVSIMYQCRTISLKARMEGRDKTEEEKAEIGRLLDETKHIRAKINEARENIHQYFNKKKGQ